MCLGRSCLASHPGVSVALSSPLRFQALLTRMVRWSRSTSPTQRALTSPNRRPVPTVTLSRSPCGSREPHGGLPAPRSVRNRSSGRDCFTRDCLGAVPIAGLATR